ncbi:FAD-binding oxidoreductase [Waterburya agarophytonicola K14]|uniref:FAD-binding oxidoreductase n=1 Tax=Waterburya agarophytonicola KI4 TaxID=2874699 RepID=A0A964FFP0_9CYAN|nr:FAD-binding oxidoreductase [Waterburya agarophytonicola]MCC0177161.1 FAD-binding oxidoreductase [Waterburya agarophytonicola KI4]
MYDWIVIGAGITGACLAYELSQQGLKVLLLEKDETPNNATIYSYGGLAYWSGTDNLTRTLGGEGIELHRNLAQELDGDTEFRDLDLVLTIDRQNDPETIVHYYDRFAITPELLSVNDACILEPLLNPNAISGALKLPHGHIHPQKTTNAYLRAFERNNGVIICDRVIDFLRQGDDVVGVKTQTDVYHADNTVVCGGGLSRSLLQQANIEIANYYTHAQLILTPPLDFELGTIVMPAVQQRFILEAKAKELTTEDWNPPYDMATRAILDPGAVQFMDGRICMGQISAIAPNPQAKLNPFTAEAEIRQQVSNILPLLEDIPGTCHSCLVAFNNQAIALVGNLADTKGIYLFSGFTSTLVFAPVLARRFARWISGKEDRVIEELQSVINH